MDKYIFCKSIIEIKDAIKEGFNIHYCDKYGWTVLFENCIKGNLDVVKFLLKLGANVNVQDIDGYTPFYWACLHNQINVIKIIIDAVDLNYMRSLDKSEFSREVKILVNTYIFNIDY